MKNMEKGISKWARAVVISAFGLGIISCGGGGGDEGGNGNGSGSDGGAGKEKPATSYSAADSMRELQRLRQCGLALFSYSTANGGEFPPADKLAEAITSEGAASLLYVGGAEEGDLPLYAEGITDSTPGPLALLASPVVMAGKRAVAFSDGSARPLSEEEFAAEKAKLKEAGFELK